MVMPGTTTGPVTATGGATATSTTAFIVTNTALNTAQQGNPLAGSGTIGAAWQGYSVALAADGNTLALGGYMDNTNAGAPWVFARSGTVWTQQGTKLVGTGRVGTSSQGASVAMSADGNTMAVGAPSDNNNTGATWVSIRSGTSWSQQGLKLVGTGAVGNASQGNSVALSADGNTLAIGGAGNDNGNGAVWVFTRSGTTWTQQGTYLVGAGALNEAYQGRAVALSADGNTLAVGGSNDGNFVGATWVFIRSGSSWSQQGSKLVGTGGVGTIRQGQAVALSANGNTLAVGAPIDNGASGATWIFARSGTAWSQQGTKLVGAGAVPNPNNVRQGWSVSLSTDGNTLAVGAVNDNVSVGATWLFARSGTVWSQQGNKLVGTGAVNNALQGSSVALSADGTTLAVGGYGDNNATGAAWVFSSANSPLAQAAAVGPRARAHFYPNPAAEQLTIAGGPGAGALRLFDGLGRAVMTGFYRTDQPLDLSSLAPGLYWLQLGHAPACPLLKR